MRRTHHCLMVTYTSGAPALSPQDKILVRQGLAVEYAPGVIAPIDFVAQPALRGALLVDHLKDATAITVTATWIHTGWLPENRLARLYAAHPTRVGPPISYRTPIPDDDARSVGGQRVTTPERTAVDLLTLEDADIAFRAIFALLGAGLSMERVEEKLAQAHRRRRIRRSRTLFLGLREYVEQRASHGFVSNP
jgi:hypothetical protein